MCKILLITLIISVSDMYAQEVKRQEYVKKVYQWFVEAQHENGLISSGEGKSYCFTYDQALAVFCYTMFEDNKRAKKVLEFFNREAFSQKEFEGFPDMVDRFGQVGGPSRAAGPNAWILLAINYYTYKTKDEQYLPLAEKIADWLVSLEGVDGGITGGYNENNRAFGWISTEHNLDCYAGFRDLYFLTKKKKYLQEARNVLDYLKNFLWYEREKRFFNGTLNPNYATDTSAWGVSALGREYADGLDFAFKKSLCTHKYDKNNVEVKGFDFGATYFESHYPDQDAVWLEGTGQMVIALQIAGKTEESLVYLKEMEKTITPSEVFPGTLGLPYATNPGTPAGSGWIMGPEPLVVSSAAWYLMAVKGVNPFSIKELEESNSIVKKINADMDYQAVPIIDGFDHGEPWILSAFPVTLRMNQDCEYDLFFTEDAKQGKGALRIHFTPGQTLAFKHSRYWSVKGIHDAWALLRRKFFKPQNWSGYNYLSYFAKIEGAPQKVRIKFIDKDSEIWQTKEIIIDNREYKEYRFSIKSDFSIDPAGTSKRGNVKFDIDQIKDMRIFISQGPRSHESDIYIDEVKLIK